MRSGWQRLVVQAAEDRIVELAVAPVGDVRLRRGRSAGIPQAVEAVHAAVVNHLVHRAAAVTAKLQRRIGFDQPGRNRQTAVRTANRTGNRNHGIAEIVVNGSGHGSGGKKRGMDISVRRATNDGQG
jgi:hypothetical protein